jgi:HEPN domain-containing protein
MLTGHLKPKKTHRLIELYQTIETNVPLEGDLKDFLQIIAPYYITTRYPDVAPWDYLKEQ